MADDADVPWSGESDVFITEIDSGLQKSSLSIRKFLLSPEQFVGNKGASQQVKSMTSAVDKYFDGLLETLADEEKALEKELQDKDAQYNRIDEVISSKAAIVRVPYARPLYVDIDQNTAEEIIIDQYDSSVDAIIVRLLNISNYVANVSGSYSKYSLGSWIFSGPKTHIITINPPASPVMVLEKCRKEINGLITSVAERIGVVTASK